MKNYTGKADSDGPAFPGLILRQLEFKPTSKNPIDDIATGIFKGRELAVDAGGSSPSWIVVLDDLSTAYRMPPSEKEEQDLLHLMDSGASAVYIEAPFGSYRPGNRFKVVQEAERNGVLLFFVDTKHSTRTLYNGGFGGPKGSKHPDGWTNAEAAVSIAQYATRKKDHAGVLTPMTVNRFTEDHTERNARRQAACLELKNLRRDKDQHYAGHQDRVDVLRGAFIKPEYEKIAFTSEVVLATLYTIARYSPQQDDIDDFFPREGSYRKTGADQGGITRSNLAYHANAIPLRNLRQATRAIRRILIGKDLMAT